MIGPRAGAAIVLLLVFAAGVLAGIVVERRHLHLAATAAAPAPVTHETAMAELRSVLALDDAQVAAIETIFAERQKTVQRVWEQLRPEVQHAMADVHHEIDEVLRPDQRDRFLTWLHQRQHNRLH